ncbi:Trk system potassium transporter TrkA (plasmid) [Natrinema zhouii]|uniref:Trk system potassium transporter TrkA n=1 Tax=Natrinema zhouii TaxID=1710539 RepID=UPI001D000402|nr:Trk system potassium transporter TrkA [Natrinema zhouii]UHQ98423.1 Trk system potassium transporter TrkA [Natrinema zhouii]
MHITVIGAGEVGRAIAATLSGLHKVVIVERDQRIVEELTYAHDVLAVHGDGREIKTLQQARIEQADLVIACTDDDEVNTVICGTAKLISDAFTIARVRHRTLYETWDGHPDAFGVDHMICTNLLTSKAIFRISGLPSAREVDTFANGLVRMAAFEIGPDSPIIKRPVREIDSDDSLTFAAIFRNEELLIPSGKTVIQPGDSIVVIGSTHAVENFAYVISTSLRSQTDDIIIAGATKVGVQTAKLFEEHGYNPRLVEQNSDKAREVAEALPNTTVFHGNPTDMDFLNREQVGEADLMISALEHDEQNLLVTLVARQLGVDETVAVVENQEYTGLFETVGVDVTVNPREETAEEIVRFTRLSPTENIVILEHNRAEVIEVEVAQDSILTDRKISNSITDLPDGVVIGAIARDDELVTPRGSTIIKSEDHIILFVDADILDEVTEAI